MGEASSRQSIIEEVRRAAASWHATKPDAYAWPPSSSQGGLVHLFVARAEAANASVCAARGYEVAVQRVADIVRNLKAPDALVSDDAWESPWNVGRLAGGETSAGSAPATRIVAARGAELPAIAKTASVGITAAAYGIAETGTIVVCSGPSGGRVASLLPPVHIALLKGSSIVAGLSDLLAAVDRDRRLIDSSAVTFITGPSRTADIELTLTIGVHGPGQLFVVVMEE